MPSSQLKLDMTIETTKSQDWVRLVSGNTKWNVPVTKLPEGWGLGDTVTITGVKKAKR